jgi:hypothetical protein
VTQCNRVGSFKFRVEDVGTELSKMSLYTYRTAWCLNPEDDILSRNGTNQIILGSMYGSNFES